MTKKRPTLKASRHGYRFLRKGTFVSPYAFNGFDRKHPPLFEIIACFFNDTHGPVYRLRSADTGEETVVPIADYWSAGSPIPAPQSVRTMPQWTPAQPSLF